MVYSQNYGASEGSYLTKTLFSFQSVYYYYQVKRVFLGDYVRFDTSGELITSDFEKDAVALPAISVAGGMGGFLLTHRWKDYTAGDALFMSANISKGSLIMSNLIRTGYLQTFWSGEKWNSLDEQAKYYVILVSGYYPGSPTMNRVGGVAQIVGGLVGAGVSYMLIKDKHLSLFEGLVYSVVPAFAYWAAWAPMVFFVDGDPRPYGSFMPLVQVALDVGTSYLIYRMLVR